MRVMYTCNVVDGDFLITYGNMFFSRNDRTDRATFLIISLLCIILYFSQ